MSDDECQFCERAARERPEIGDWVLRNEFVSACILPGAEYPGWFVLLANSHVEGLGLMTRAQAAAVGLGARQLTAAITAVMGEPRVYSYSICENFAHFHLVMGSPPRQAPERGRALLVEILNRNPRYLDHAAALAVAADVARVVESNNGAV